MKQTTPIMYHIKQDMRSLLSARMLQEGLSQCLYDKKYTDISICELCESSHVSRTTFYRLFDSMDDLLQYTLDSLADKAEEQLSGKDHMTPRQYLDFCLTFIKDNVKLYDTILLTGRSNVLAQSLKRIHDRHISSNLDSLFSKEEKDYLTAFVISTAISLSQVKLSHGRKDRPEDIWNFLQKLFRIFSEETA